MKSLLGVVLAVALVLSAALTAQAGEFYADLVKTVDGKPVPGGKIYIKGDKIRLETLADGQNQVLITDPAAGKVYLLQPEAKTVLEMPFDPKKAGTVGLANDQADQVQWRVVGRESVGGWDCEKRVLDKTASQGQATVWFSEKLGHTVKAVLTEGGKTMTVEYQHIKAMKVSPTLFTIPDEYQKSAMPLMNEGMGADAPAGNTAKPEPKPGM